MKSRELELKVDAGDRECHSDGDLDVKETCDIAVEVFSSDGEYGVEKEGCEVPADVNGGCVVETEAGDDFADEFHTPDAAEKDCELTFDVNGGCVVEAEGGADVADEVHSPDAAEKDCELTVNVNGGCVAKTEAGEVAYEVHSPDVVGPDSAEKDCELIVDVNGGCVLETKVGDVADDSHSDDTGPGAAEKDCEATVHVNGGCAVAKEESHLNADAHSHDAILDEEKKECEKAVKEDVTVDANNAAVNGECLVGKEEGNLGQREISEATKEDIERRIGHYTNRQKILLVGEGDFSFAACLAKAFGRATNITATSLDDRASVISKYSNGEKNLQSLEDYGATVIHQVHAHTMNRHPELEQNLYDRVVFNFPHYGDFYGGEHQAWVIENHQKVVAGFFRAAKYMVGRNGEVHVTHKTANPFDRWNIEELAEDAGLVLQRKADFCKWDYPGYENKKAYGIWPDSTFPVDRCSTFMFSTG